MRRKDRLEKMVAILRERGNASIEYLANWLDTSDSTIRRDINYMCALPEYAFIKKVIGGLILLDQKMGLEYMFGLKLDLNSELKQRIALKALEYVDDGDSLILDSGTTCLVLARLLHQRRGIRVLTTDVKVAEELGRYADIESLIIAGNIRPGYFTIGGDIAVSSLNSFNVEKAFLSADAVDIARGVTNSSAFEVGVKKKILEISARAYLLADHTKFNKVAMYQVTGIESFTQVISDALLEQSCQEALRERRISLDVV